MFRVISLYTYIIFLDRLRLILIQTIEHENQLVFNPIQQFYAKFPNNVSSLTILLENLKTLPLKKSLKVPQIQHLEKIMKN